MAPAIAPATSIEALKAAPLFSRLPDEALVPLAAIARRRTFRRREVIFHQGDAGSALHVLVAGKVKVIGSTESGGETILAILGPGDCFGELSLIDGEPRSARVEALEAVETITLARDDFLDVVLGDRTVTQHLLAALTRMVRRLTDSVGDLTTYAVEGRLASKLLQLADQYGEMVDGAVELQLSVTVEELAAMVGAVRPTVNQLMVRWEERGIIVRRGRHIAILDPERLHRRIM
jgi:CRP-like cAMP-binding protein